MKRFTYYIAAHHKPDQLRRFIDTVRLGSPESNIVLHLDATKGLIDAADFAELPGVHIVPNPTRVEWGLYSQLEMNFNTLSWMRGHVPFDWVVYLSGQDYPLQPLETIERFYREGGDDGYVSGVPLDDGAPCDPAGCPQADPDQAADVCPECSSRYYYRYHNIATLAKIAERIPLLRRAYRHFKKRAGMPGGRLHMRTWPDPAGERPLLGIRDRRLFTKDFRCYKGSAWFTLNERAVGRLLDVLAAKPEIASHFKRTLIPDEVVIQTILCNQPDLSICDDNQRFLDWENIDSPHPTTLTAGHYDRMVASGKHFARKFDMETDPGIFDLLDRRIFGDA